MKQSKHRILLIEPPFYRLFKETYGLAKFPLALGYLSGAILRETSWNVCAYNADFIPQSENWDVSHLAGEGFHRYIAELKDAEAPIWREVKSTIQEYAPDVVGISSKSQSFASACMVARLAKEVDRRIVVIVGGPHPSMVGADVLDCPDIDMCVKGEGENTIVELLNAIASQEEFNGILGICYRKDDSAIENPQRALIENLDSLCFPYEPAHEVLIDYDKYPLTAFRSVFATRGCPYNCLFCGSREIWSRKVRLRSPESVIHEIKELQAAGLDTIHFDDDTFGINRKYINTLCDHILAHCPGLKWSCELHVKLVDEETVSRMKAAGCLEIQVGIESGNNEVLKENRKGITIEEALSACEIIKRHDIRLITFFMVGFPQETEETLNDTFEAMKKARDIGCDYLVYSIFTPYPGTEAFELCRRNGMIEDDWDVSLYNHQSPANHFSAAISPERFRILASEIEEMVDHANSREPEPIPQQEEAASSIDDAAQPGECAPGGSFSADGPLGIHGGLWKRLKAFFSQRERVIKSDE